MTKTVMILTMLVFGCGTNTVDTRNVNTNDSMSQDRIGINREGEDFNEFFKAFASDSSFQIERIKFPLPMMTWEPGEDAPMKELINRRNWKYRSFYYENSYTTRQIDV